MIPFCMAFTVAPDKEVRPNVDLLAIGFTILPLLPARYNIRAKGFNRAAEQLI